MPARLIPGGFGKSRGDASENSFVYGVMKCILGIVD